MTRLVKFFAVLPVLLVVTACNTMQTRSSEPPALSRIAERGELVLGTSATMQPMSYKRSDGKVVGLDVDIARFMASAMDAKLTIKTMPFQELLPALERGEVDVVISNMTMTTRRNLKVAFVGPYMKSGKCIITREENLARAEQAEDLNTPDTRIAVMRGSTSEDFVRTLLPSATVTATEDITSGVELVRDDRVDGMLADYPVCLSTLKENPDDGFVSLFSLLSYEPIGIALPGNDPLFINWTKNFMTRMEATGILDELSQRWFGSYGDALKID